MHICVYIPTHRVYTYVWYTHRVYTYVCILYTYVCIHICVHPMCRYVCTDLHIGCIHIPTYRVYTYVCTYTFREFAYVCTLGCTHVYTYLQKIFRQHSFAVYIGLF